MVIFGFDGHSYETGTGKKNLARLEKPLQPFTEACLKSAKAPRAAGPACRPSASGHAGMARSIADRGS
jgi:hypothetical protein